MARTYIQGIDSRGGLAMEIERALNRGGSERVSSLEEATAVLAIHGERTRRTVLSVDSSGKAREYELALSFTFSLKDSQLMTLVEEQEITVERDVSYDSENVLGSEREEATTRTEMRRFAVRQMINRLRIALERGNYAKTQSREGKKD